MKRSEASTNTVAAVHTVAANTDATDWHLWCRLCAKEHPDNTNVYFKDGEQIWTSMLAVAIGKFFWVNIKMEDELSNVLCKECYTLVEALIEFSERVNRVQALFGRLQNAAPHAVLNYDELRTQCGLHSNEWKHIISRTLKSEPTDEKMHLNEEFLSEDSEQFDEEAEILAEIEGEELLESEPFEPYSVHEGEVDENMADDPPTHSEVSIELNTENIDDESETTYELVADDIKYKCQLCRKSYKQPMAYRKHMSDAHNLQPDDLPDLTCKRCQRSFATDCQLTAHYRTHLITKDKAIHSCNYCMKHFTTAAALRRHVIGMHEDQKPFMCDVCGKPLKTLTALNEHKLVHTDECPFECPVCHRRFKNKARLKIHSDTHTNNNYECNICGMKLNTRRTLNMHKLVHSDKKQYKCEVCGAEFKRGKTLKSHLILHTGIRPYKCNFCGKDFSNGSNCRMHKRKTHPKELAEEEARGVMRATTLPMLNELTEASKKLKTPRKVCISDKMKALLMVAEKQQPQIVQLSTEMTDGSQTSEMDGSYEDDTLLYE